MNDAVFISETGADNAASLMASRPNILSASVRPYVVRGAHQGYRLFLRKIGSVNMLPMSDNDVEFYLS